MNLLCPLTMNGYMAAIFKAWEIIKEREDDTWAANYSDQISSFCDFFKVLWPSSTTNCSGLLATNSLSEIYQVLCSLATTNCGGSGRKHKLFDDVLPEQWSLYATRTHRRSLLEHSRVKIILI